MSRNTGHGMPDNDLAETFSDISSLRSGLKHVVEMRTEKIIYVWCYGLCS